MQDVLYVLHLLNCYPPISDWAHFLNASVLAGSDIVGALAKKAQAADFPYKDDRGLLILAEMTTKGSLAVGSYTQASVEIARKHSDFALGFVATRTLSGVGKGDEQMEGEDFVIFTTGVNRSSPGDALRQQYQTPSQAIANGADFIISGSGIYAAVDPVEAVELYQKEGWEAYLERTSGGD